MPSRSTTLDSPPVLVRASGRGAAGADEPGGADIYNDDAERAVLGSILHDEAGLDIARRHGITPDAFHVSTNRSVYHAMLALAQRGRAVDTLTVCAELKNSGDLDALGGCTFVERLMEAVPTVTSIVHYADIVLELAERRRLAAGMRRLTESVEAGGSADDTREGIRALGQSPVTGVPALVSLADLAEQEVDADQTLIGAKTCRYLERGGVLLMAAPSGVGKSHWATQGAVCWACGIPAFGLPTANGPLRVLKLQAEDPPNDAHQMAANMLRGLELGPKQREMVRENTRQTWLPGCTGQEFLDRVHVILTAWRADLVIVDPLAGFADGDLVRPEVVQSFCRAGLSRLAVENRCALLICHHVPKPNANRDASRMGAYDFQYAGAGSADLVANWPRAVLTLQPLARGQFILRAAKRRPPWSTADGRQAWEIGLRHTDAGTWETCEVDKDTARTGRPPAPTPETFRPEVMALIRESGAMPKTALCATVRAKVTGSRDGARAAVELLVSDGSLATWRGVGRGGCAMIGLPGQAPRPKEATE